MKNSKNMREILKDQLINEMKANWKVCIHHNIKICVK